MMSISYGFQCRGSHRPAGVISVSEKVYAIIVVVVER